MKIPNNRVLLGTNEGEQMLSRRVEEVPSIRQQHSSGTKWVNATVTGRFLSGVESSGVHCLPTWIPHLPNYPIKVYFRTPSLLTTVDFLIFLSSQYMYWWREMHMRTTLHISRVEKIFWWPTRHQLDSLLDSTCEPTRQRHQKTFSCASRTFKGWVMWMWEMMWRVIRVVVSEVNELLLKIASTTKLRNGGYRCLFLGQDLVVTSRIVDPAVASFVSV